MQNFFHPFKNLGEVKQSADDFRIESETEEALESKRLKTEEGKKNYWVFTLLCLGAAIILVYRLLNLQVIEGFHNQFLAQGNWLRVRSISSPRGLIYDKNGKKLVQNVPTFQAELKANELPKKKADKDQIIKKASEVFGVSVDEINNQIKKKAGSVDPVVLKEKITHDEALLYETKIIDLPSITIEANSVRQYEIEGAVSHFLGYVGQINKDEYSKNSGYDLTDVFGKTGLEKSYEKYLSGEKGIEKIEVDSTGRYQRTLSTIDPCLLARPGSRATRQYF
jgi:penicillin-binding protein 2